MPWLVDGSNVLGAMQADRHSDDAKRLLVRMLTRFARAQRTKITCVFDGSAPASFAAMLGAVSVVFSAARSADQVIAERSATGRGWTVVTSDRALAERVRRREVAILSCAAFLRKVEQSIPGDDEGGEDWADYFSDPKNRIDF